ncbi:hypothetical protein [Pedobacter sp.]|uniref:hypothetical protein n=1 Tax=Pedobacter sp. TaxID=1411316 RepID=UPI00396C5888
MENENSHQEGEMTKKIENQTAKIPSDFFLWTSIAAMGLSLGLKCMKHKHMALFVGQWVAPFLLFGVYNKIVKTHGHDEKEM